uniref:Uncharacterized protein n=1 Tax=Solanum lycopersicum TaxID=4081 RepID=A0A3Q7H5Z5_SOLLC
MPNFFVDLCQVLVYAYGCPSRLVRPIWKHTIYWVIRIPMSKIPKFFCGRRSRPCLCRRLALTASPTHFEGQTSPEARIPLISMIFESKIPKIFVDVRQYPGYVSSWPSRPIQLIFNIKRAPKRAYPNFDDFVIRIPTSKMPKNFVDVCQDLGCAASWPSRPVRPIFKVKRAPKRAYPICRRFSCAIANHF